MSGDQLIVSVNEWCSVNSEWGQLIVSGNEW